jgi:hypothetical protein
VSEDHQFPLTLQVSIEGVPADDELVLDDTRVLRRALRDIDMSVVESSPGDGKAGEVAVPIIEAVVNGTGFTALAVVIRHYLSRRGDRRLSITTPEGGTYVVEGHNVDDKTILEGLRKVVDAN